MTKLTNIFNKYITLKEIDAFENEMGIKLPPKFKQFLLESNGGSAEPNCFTIAQFAGNSSIVDFFYGLNVSTPYGDLAKNLERYKERIPDSFIPVGCDPADNIICVGISPPFIDKVYLWDYEEELDHKGLSKMDMSNMYWLADDIYEFLSKLFSEEE